MPGGLLNLIAVGQGNLILNGNPKKTFWKTSYSKYTNFGMQKFRLDFNGQRTLRLNEQSKFTFKYPRYGDLVMDSYLVITIPNIWSPLFPIQDNRNFGNSDVSNCNPDLDPNDCETNTFLCNNTYYIPYNFKWIENLGLTMIDEIEVTVGGQTLQKYSGDYLTSMINRDFPNQKKDLINEMTGNTKYYYDPQYADSNILQKYPNAVYDTSAAGAEPSIRGRNLYIPLNLWFGMTSKQAFPLISLQYNELQVHVTLKAIRDLFTIRDVQNPYNNYAWKAPNFNEPSDQLYRFLQKPVGVPRRIPITNGYRQNNNYSLNDIGPPETTNDFYDSYTDKRSNWDSDIHIITTYAFLGDDERRVFASQPQEYLIKEIYEQDFYNVVESVKLNLNSSGMVSSWMWFARRNDAFLRNQWNNYTNWKYPKNPNTINIPNENYTAMQPWYDYIKCSMGDSTSTSTSNDYNKNGCYRCGVVCDNNKPNGGEFDNRFKPYINQYNKLPTANPYSYSNFNTWLRSREFDISYGTLSKLPDNVVTLSGAIFNNGVQTILDQKGFYPPSSDIICDNVKGPYIGAAEVNSSNGQLITPVWVEQGSINTNYPLYCPSENDNEVCVPNMGVFKSFSSFENQSESYNQLINNTIKINSVKGIEMFISLSPEEQYLLVGKLEFTLNYSTFSQVISNQSEETLENLTNNYTFETISGETVDFESSDSEYNLSISGTEYNISISSEIEYSDICGSNIDLNNTIITPSFSEDYKSLANGEIKIFSSNGRNVFYTLNNWEKLSLISITGDISNSELGKQDENNPCYAQVSSEDPPRIFLGDFFGSPFNNTVFPLCWGSANVLPSPFSTSGSYTMENSYDIIKTCGILLDGKVRENILEAGIYEYIEKYQKSSGNGSTPNGLLCYNFCLHTNPYDLQPSGAMNLSKFTTIELEITTMTPPIDDKAQYANICKEEVLPDGTIQSIQIGVNKPSWSIFEYTYDIHFMEERYNIVKFVGGNVGLEFTR